MELTIKNDPRVVRADILGGIAQRMTNELIISGVHKLLAGHLRDESIFERRMRKCRANSR